MTLGIWCQTETVKLILRQAMRLLIVEDSEDDAELLRCELAHTGKHFLSRRVDCAADMRAALQEGDWDLIISDHSMPGFSSLEALNILKESGRDIPFIIYSGNISEQAAVSALHEGVHDFVTKGNVARLIPSIRRELENAANRRAMRQAENHLRQLAYYDELTGLGNRNLFFEEVNRALSARSKTDPLAVIALVNLDRFSRINHVVGFVKAGELLKQVAGRLQAVGEATGILARLGDDRFALFRADISDYSETRAFAEQIMRSLAPPLVVDGLEFYVTASVGLSVYPNDGADVSTLVVNAECAAQLARKLGGNNYKYYVKEMGEAMSRRLTLEAALRRAVERRQLVVNYQPIVDVATGRIIGSEALVRWNHPERGMLFPDEFIAAADETGIIVEIGEWMLNQACRQTRIWQDESRLPLSVSINVSAVQFGQPKLLAQVARALADSELDPRHLELELTESVLMQDAEDTIETLCALKKMGTRISVDDFGTGYSSLSYLNRFPIDVLKIDKSFIRGIAHSGDDYAIVRAITALAKSLNLSVVAEGVELPEQVAVLRREKCDRAQGYLFSKPLSAEEFHRLIADSDHEGADVADCTRKGAAGSWMQSTGIVH